jgi:hypothetical protein
MTLCPTTPKDPRAFRAGSFAAPAAAPSCTTHSGGAPLLLLLTLIS